MESLISCRYCTPCVLSMSRFGPLVSGPKPTMTKSPNKHNRLRMYAEFLGDELANAIDDDTVSARDDPKKRNEVLINKFEFDKVEVKKIWCFGPETSGPNLLIDKTQGVQYLHEIKDSMEAGF